MKKINFTEQAKAEIKKVKYMLTAAEPPLRRIEKSVLMVYLNSIMNKTK